jgi:hypothetical protein
VWEDKGATASEFRSLKEVARVRVQEASAEHGMGREGWSTGDEDPANNPDEEEAVAFERMYGRRLSAFELDKRRADQLRAAKAEEAREERALAKKKGSPSRKKGKGPAFDQFLRGFGGGRGRAPPAGSAPSGPAAWAPAGGDKFSPANQLHALRQLWSQDEQPTWGRTDVRAERGRLFGYRGAARGAEQSLAQSERAAAAAARTRANLEIVERIMSKMPRTAGGSLRLPTARQRRLDAAGAHGGALPPLPASGSIRPRLRKLPGSVKVVADPALASITPAALRRPRRFHDKWDASAHLSPSPPRALPGDARAAAARAYEAKIAALKGQLGGEPALQPGRLLPA